MVLFGRSILLVFIGIGAVEWLTMARIVRGQTMALKQRGFVTAAEAAGAPGRLIVARHILPNLAGVAFAYLMLTVPQVVMVERSEEHTSELQSLMRISYAVLCLKKKTT